MGRKTPSYQRREKELHPSVEAAPTPRRGLDLALYGLQAALADLERVDQGAADMARSNIANQLVTVALHIDQQTKDRKESAP
ncbi:hypothetical protein [Streptosporangium sp. NPDC001681]|uniref:hypothetical protein n=1 Tax=Streptosporangium sp. NPDC001681 TaxID=3154395 RepID=UPI0033302F3C